MRYTGEHGIIILHQNDITNQCCNVAVILIVCYPHSISSITEREEALGIFQKLIFPFAWNQEDKQTQFGLWTVLNPELSD